MYQLLLPWLEQAFVLSGGVPNVNCPEMLERSGLLKAFLKEEQKQLQALDALQELTSTMKRPQSECLSLIYL